MKPLAEFPGSGCFIEKIKEHYWILDIRPFEKLGRFEQGLLKKLSLSGKHHLK
jgi:hypothetical protein